MKPLQYRYLLFLGLFINGNIAALSSMVYSFRIAQITGKPIFKDTDKKYSVIPLLFDVYQKKHCLDISQNFVGTLGAFIYNFGKNYARVDFAWAHIHEKVDHTTTYSQSQTDDILCTIGHSITPVNWAHITFSGLLGIPTHPQHRLQHVDFGYNQVGLGAQVDGSLNITRANNILYGLRYIYFVPRNAQDVLCVDHRFSVGNVVDVLAAVTHEWHNNHSLELGYTFREQFGASVTPAYNDIIERTDYQRNSFYAVYSYKFLISSIDNRLLFYTSYGYDSKPQLFGNKFIVTAWASWNISF